VSDSPVATAHRLLAEAVDALSLAAGTGATDAELLSVLTVCEGLSRRLDRLTVSTVSVLQRRGTFAERGYKSTAHRPRSTNCICSRTAADREGR
jgi:5-methylcytosine-specific restriction protein A